MVFQTDAAFAVCKALEEQRLKMRHSASGVGGLGPVLSGRIEKAF